MMNKAPNLINSYQIDFYKDTQKCVAGVWVPARPVGRFGFSRLKLAWKVFTGQYDALWWPGQ